MKDVKCRFLLLWENCSCKRAIRLVASYRVHNGTDPIVHLESKGWKLEVAQISGNDHAFIRLYLMSKVVTKEELEAGITGVTEK